MVLFAYVPLINAALAGLTESLLGILVFIVEQINQLPHAVISADQIEPDAIRIVFYQLVFAGIVFMIPRLLTRLPEISGLRLLGKRRPIRSS